MPKRQAPIPPYALVLLLVVVLGGAFLALKLPPKEPPPAPPQASKPKPFSDMPPEKPPPPRSGSGTYGNTTTILAPAPADLESFPAWQQAKRLGTEGEALYREAREAKDRGDTATLNAKGRAAKEKLNEAVELTGAWEDEIVAKYGDGEPAVREIVRTRSHWMSILDWLLKGSGR